MIDKRDKIKDISSGMLSELGLEADEVIGKKFYDIIGNKMKMQVGQLHSYTWAIYGCYNSQI